MLKTFKTLLLLITMMVAIGSIAPSSVYAYGNFDNCVLEKMKGQAGSLLQFAIRSCRDEFPVVKNEVKEKPAAKVKREDPFVVAAKEKIGKLVIITEDEPDNLNAWIQLGNNYFDANMPSHSIDAYRTALKLDPRRANVWTDMGVMYRKIGDYETAIDCFRQAFSVDPKHAQSRFNLGAVYRYDLGDNVNARKAWVEYLKVNPTGGGADQVRKEIAQMDE